MAKSNFKPRRHERTADDVRRKSSEGNQDFDNLWVGDIKLFKAKAGENNIRIMPATFGFQPYTDDELKKMPEDDLRKMQEEEDKWGDGWDLPVFIHYRVGPDNGSYICRAKMLDERCPICEAREKTSDPDEEKALAPKKRGLAWIIDRDAEKEGPQLWPMPLQQIRNEIYSRSVDKKHGTPIKIEDPEEGYDISFTRVGTDERTDYKGVDIDRSPTPLHEDEKKQQRWLDYTMDHPLQDIMNFYPAEHIEKVLSGRASSRRDEEDDEDDTSSSRTRSRTRGSSRSRRASDEDEETDYMREEDAPEPEETSSRRTRRSARRSEPDDEDEAPSPRTRSRRRPAAEPEEEEPDVEEDDEDEASPPPRGRVPRRSRPEEDAEEPEDDADEGPTEQARGRLRSLRGRSRK